MDNKNMCPHCHETNGKPTYCYYYLDRRDGQIIYARYCGDCGRKLAVKKAQHNG